MAKIIKTFRPGSRHAKRSEPSSISSVSPVSGLLFPLPIIYLHHLHCICVWKNELYYIIFKYGWLFLTRWFSRLDSAGWWQPLYPHALILRYTSCLSLKQNLFAVHFHSTWLFFVIIVTFVKLHSDLRVLTQLQLDGKGVNFVLDTKIFWKEKCLDLNFLFDLLT